MLAILALSVGANQLASFSKAFLGAADKIHTEKHGRSLFMDGASMSPDAVLGLVCHNGEAGSLVSTIIPPILTSSMGLSSAEMDAIPVTQLMNCVCSNAALFDDSTVAPLIAAMMGGNVGASMIPMLQSALPLVFSSAHMCSSGCKSAWAALLAAVPMLVSLQQGRRLQPGTAELGHFLGESMMTTFASLGTESVDCFCQMDWHGMLTTQVNAIMQSLGMHFDGRQLQALGSGPVADAVAEQGSSSSSDGESAVLDGALAAMVSIAPLLSPDNLCDSSCSPVVSALVATVLHDFMYPQLSRVFYGDTCQSDMILQSCVGGCASRSVCDQCGAPQCAPPFSTAAIRPLLSQCLCQSGVDYAALMQGVQTFVTQASSNPNPIAAIMAAIAAVTPSRLCTAPACNSLLTGLLQSVPNTETCTGQCAVARSTAFMLVDKCAGPSPDGGNSFTNPDPSEHPPATTGDVMFTPVGPGGRSPDGGGSAYLVPILLSVLSVLVLLVGGALLVKRKRAVVGSTATSTVTPPVNAAGFDMGLNPAAVAAQSSAGNYNAPLAATFTSAPAGGRV